MFFFLLARFIISPTFTTNIPKIDGVIEPFYQSCPPASDFVQFIPFSGKKPLDSTNVYIIYNRKNLYVFFQCFTSDSEKVDAKICPRDDWEGDHVWIIFDTNKDKTTAYEFCVNAAGVQRDGIIYSDGRNIDLGWDGVWYSAVKITEYGYNVELKIPFKTMRFIRENNEWGVNILRYISCKNEYDCWAPITRNEGVRVSKCGTLKGIFPGESGLHLELYPSGILRYEDGFIPRVGGDINWNFSSSLEFSFTSFPDFAQIEADPYTINLSKYELYFSERRPFFTQQVEYFRSELSSFINPFYSRRIGKKLPDGTEVPIIYGGKFAGTFGRWDIGVLNAITKEAKYNDYYSNTLKEERSNFYCVRIKRRVLKNSSLGLLYAGKHNSQTNNEVYSMDGTFRTKNTQSTYLLAISDKNGEKDFGGELNLDYQSDKYVLQVDIKGQNPNFNIDEIGYAPYIGYQSCSFYGGLNYYNEDKFRDLQTGVGFEFDKEDGEPSHGWNIYSKIRSTFLNNVGIYIKPGLSHSYEMEKRFCNYHLDLAFWTDHRKSVSLYPYFWFNSYDYNYRRGHFGANGGGELTLKIRPSSRLSISLTPKLFLEWEEDKSLEEKSYIMTSSLDYFFTKDLHLRLYAEPNTNTHIHYFSGLLSWNFKPKTWFYLAYNEERDNTEGNWALKDRIFVAKIRYLFFW